MPIIQFRHAPLLDNLFHQSGHAREPIEDVATRIEEYKLQWQEIASRVMDAIPRITNLTFSEDVVGVYISSCLPRVSGISDPLVISTKVEPERFPDVLTHELIHRVYSYNQEGVDYKKIQFGLYPTEDPVVVYHVFVHAVHKQIYEEVLQDPDRYAREIKLIEDRGLALYKRAWDIVNAAGYRSVIEAFDRAR
jgi:hypothetical protein